MSKPPKDPTPTPEVNPPTVGDLAKLATMSLTPETIKLMGDIGDMAREQIADGLRENAANLRRTFAPIDSSLQRSLQEPIQIPRPVNPEVQATYAVREEIANLARITAAMSDQTAAQVELQGELTRSFKKLADDSRRAATIQIVLAVILVGLTVALVWLTSVLAEAIPPG